MPTEALLQAADPVSRTKSAEACPHSQTRTELQQPTDKHYAALRCARCGLFLSWVPKPETVQRRKLLERLATDERLTASERSFIGTLIVQKGRMSPLQGDWYRDILSRYNIESEATK
jgi:hypothetical protein